MAKAVVTIREAEPFNGGLLFQLNVLYSAAGQPAMAQNLQLTLTGSDLEGANPIVTYRSRLVDLVMANTPIVLARTDVYMIGLDRGA